MQLMIENQLRTFIPIKTFRAQHDLPHDFGIWAFEPKDYSGLGRVKDAGAQLNEVRQAVLDAIPTEMVLQGWLEFLPHLTSLFKTELHRVNPDIGLKEVEIDYAVSGLMDVCHALVYAMIRARAAGQPWPTFESVYHEWLNNTVRVANTTHSYIHKGQVWAVQVLNHAYGRAGLVVWTDTVTYYIEDSSQACPVDGFMEGLLSAAAERILAATL